MDRWAVTHGMTYAASSGGSRLLAWLTQPAWAAGGEAAAKLLWLTAGVGSEQCQYGVHGRGSLLAASSEPCKSCIRDGAGALVSLSSVSALPVSQHHEVGQICTLLLMFSC